MGRVLRVLFGFVIACLAAGLALVLFVHTPAEFPEWPAEKFSETAMLALAVGTQAAIFAAPFAFIGTIYSEWRGLSSATYSVGLGILIALLGFWVQYTGEAGGPDTIFNIYAVIAFIVTGFVGGIVYWLLSGRCAGGRRSEGDGSDASGTPNGTPFAVKKPVDTAPTSA
ncbi:MAG: hypothetical protein NW223_07710 [Hyphomicrobiaceae bacterium]|nr:hypothetical protein [Hyphomicrobiaceae bacterium]